MTTKLERISELSNQEVKVEYGYSNDRLTRITHNGFNYGFGYDEFGKTRLVAIAGSSVVSYEYEEKNGKLLKTKYANGDYLRYEYDTQGRLVKKVVDGVTTEYRMAGSLLACIRAHRR